MPGPFTQSNKGNEITAVLFIYTRMLSVFKYAILS